MMLCKANNKAAFAACYQVVAITSYHHPVVLQLSSSIFLLYMTTLEYCYLKLSNLNDTLVIVIFLNCRFNEV